MKIFLLGVFVLMITNCLYAGKLLVVMIDDKTENIIGKFPYDRSVLAQAVNVAHESNAKAVVLKFFLDLPKSEQGDKALSESMKNIPTILQAAIDNSEKNPNIMSEKFSIMTSLDQKSISGDSGWNPLKIFANNAYDVGYANIRDPYSVPAVVKYRGKVYKSIWISTLEILLNQKSRIDYGNKIYFKDKGLILDNFQCIKIELPKKDEIEYVSFVDFINGTIDKDKIKDNVIIIGYDGINQPIFDTTIGKIKAHRLFLYALNSLIRQLDY